MLSGGGAYGLAHIGVLRALEHYGLAPSTVVGVSMGAIVGSFYALNPNWYAQLKAADLTPFSQLFGFEKNLRERAQSLATVRRVLATMVTGWGAGTRTLAYEWSLFHRLTRLKHLDEGRVPLAVTATDLTTGERVVLRDGDAAKAIYASSAIPGVFPPLELRGGLLADGGFTDNAPVDVARELLPGPVVVINVGQSYLLPRVHNGATALYQAVSSGLGYHTTAQLRTADLVLRPAFPDRFGALYFVHKRKSVAAGVAVVRENLERLRALTRPQPWIPVRPHGSSSRVAERSQKWSAFTTRS